MNKDLPCFTGTVLLLSLLSRFPGDVVMLTQLDRPAAANNKGAGLVLNGCLVNHQTQGENPKSPFKMLR